MRVGNGYDLLFYFISSISSPLPERSMCSVYSVDRLYSVSIMEIRHISLTIRKKIREKKQSAHIV